MMPLILAWRQVDSAKPVDTFWTMLNDETTDLVSKAVAGMVEVIKNLLEHTVACHLHATGSWSVLLRAFHVHASVTCGACH